MEWNNMNVYEVGEGVDTSSNYFVQPHQPGAVAVSVVSSEDGGVDVIPLDQSSNVVLRTLEGFTGGAEGVEVIGILEEGQQQFRMLENLNEMGVSVANEELLAQLSQNPQLLQSSNAVVVSGVSSGQGEITFQTEEGGITTMAISTLAHPQPLPESNVVYSNVNPILAPLPNLLPIETPIPVPMEVVPQQQQQQQQQQQSHHIESLGAIKGEAVVDESQPGMQERPLHEEMEDVLFSSKDDSELVTPTTESTAEDVKPEAPDISADMPTPPSPGIFLGDTKNEADDGQEVGKDIQEPESILPDIEPTNEPISHPSVVVLNAATMETVGVIDSSNPRKRKRQTSGSRTSSPTKKHAVEEKMVEIIISDDSDNDNEYGLPVETAGDPEDDIIYLSSDEEDEQYKTEMRNALALHKLRQSVDVTVSSYRPRFFSRELLHKKHPKCKDLNFQQIVEGAVREEKILPDLNEQMMTANLTNKLRCKGYSLFKMKDGGCVITTSNKNLKLYHSQFSARFEPILTNPVLENYVQVFRRSLLRRMERGRLEVDPSSVIPASIGSTGSSSIGSETDPECLATDEEESESELMQGSVAAWIIPDAIPSRTPSPEPDFDEPQFITTQVGSHTIVEGPPTKKRKQKHHEPKPHTDGKIYPKPAFSYSCLIAMALKNSKTGSLPVSEIYKFMCDHFPYFKSAPSGWKNSVRHNLSLNKCFEKIEKPGNNGARKGCLWALNPAKIHKMDEEVQKWARKDPVAIRKAMSDPENLPLIERGELKRDYSGAGSDDDEDEDFSEPATPLTPAQAQARRSRTNSSDSTLEGVTAVVTPVVTTVSQVHAALQRSIDSKSQTIQVKREDNSVDLGTITNIQGNYVCHTPNGNGTYTLSFANIGSSSPLTPIIIRRTPTVK